MELPSYFIDFLQNIRPTESDRQAFQAAHIKLRRLLTQDDRLSPAIMTTFLQGSYRRATALHAYKNHRPDVDVVVVSRLSSSEYTPTKALNCFKPFLKEHYPSPDDRGMNERSLWITDDGVDLDLVITSAPAYAEEGILSGQGADDSTAEDDEGNPSADQALWKLEPLLIPDRQVEQWQQTHPLAQLAWTRTKNRNTNGCFVNVVKALKWWKRITFGMPKHPRSYPLEHLIGACCPDGITDVATGVVRTLETMVAQYAWYAQCGQVPVLPNHGIASQNVFARVPREDFQSFMERAQGAARLARRALDSQSVPESVSLWQELFGSEFPSNGSGGFTPRKDESKVGGGRFG